MVHAETDTMLQVLKQAHKMEELLRQVKPNSGLSVSKLVCVMCCEKWCIVAGVCWSNACCTVS